MLRKCAHCDDNVTVRDEREGIIHTNGKYGCRGRRQTVAE